jgi:hypothetical protein
MPTGGKDRSVTARDASAHGEPIERDPRSRRGRLSTNFREIRERRMAVIGDRLRSSRPTVLMSAGLLANMAPIATFAAVSPEISAAWGLSAGEAGWIGGIYFGGYTPAVAVLASLTDRIDGRWVVVGSAMLGAAASLAFAAGGDGFWARWFLGGARAASSPADCG